MALVFAFLLLMLRCPCVHLYCELIHQCDSVQTLLTVCKLHAWFYVVGESLLTAAQISQLLDLSNFDHSSLRFQKNVFSLCPLSPSKMNNSITGVKKSGIATLSLFHLIWLDKPCPCSFKTESLQQKRKSEWLFLPAFSYSLEAFHMLTGKNLGKSPRNIIARKPDYKNHVFMSNKEKGTFKVDFGFN